MDVIHILLISWIVWRMRRVILDHFESGARSRGRAGVATDRDPLPPLDGASIARYVSHWRGPAGERGDAGLDAGAIATSTPSRDPMWDRELDG